MAADRGCLAVSGAALIVWGFFLPWFEGQRVAGRDFSGFDLARLVRNFEVVATSSSEEGQLRLTAVVLYLAPALAVNGAVFAVVPPLRAWAAWALGVGAGYVLFVLVASGVLAVVSWTELERVMGQWAIGYFLSIAGVGLLEAAWVTAVPARGRRQQATSLRALFTKAHEVCSSGGAGAYFLADLDETKDVRAGDEAEEVALAVDDGEADGLRTGPLARERG